MSHHIPAVSWDQGARAVARRRHRPPRTPRPRLFLLATIDHYLSEDVHAMMPVPHYSSSAMDGYAVAGQPALASGAAFLPGGFSSQYSPSHRAD